MSVPLPQRNASQFDVAIIGAGLAGCSAAITLAKQGIRVILLEGKHYPQHKVCGEFLSPECTALLDELGLSEPIAAVAPTAINTVRITAPGGVQWQTRLPGTAIGLSRYALDALMAAQAQALGVEFCQETAVTGVTGSLDLGFTLQIRAGSAEAHLSVIEARTVIGAQGKRSSLDRALNRRFLRKMQPFVGLKAHFHGPRLPGRIELHTFTGGYCGMSEVEGGRVNVCLLVRESVLQAASQFDGSESQPLDGFIRWMCAQNDDLGTWLAQAERITERWLSIGQVPFVPKRQMVNDILMAGDSAGLITPLAGDGMGMALEGGQLAANYVSCHLAGTLTAEQVRREYPAHWQRKFNGRLRLGRLLQAIILRPALLAPGLHLINRVPALGTYFVTHTRDVKTTYSAKESDAK